MEAKDFINRLYAQGDISDTMHCKYSKCIVEYENELIIKQAITTLENIITLLKEGKYQEIVDTYVSYSPAGDGMGMDNHFINFSDNGEEMDIYDLLLFVDDKIKD